MRSPGTSKSRPCLRPGGRLALCLLHCDHGGCLVSRVCPFPSTGSCQRRPPPLPPREAQQGPAGFETLQAHVLGRGRHRAKPRGLSPQRSPRARSGQALVRGAQDKRGASCVRATVRPHSVTPCPWKTPPVRRDRPRRWGPRVVRALSPHRASAWEMQGRGWKAVVGLRPRPLVWRTGQPQSADAWVRSERARPASGAVGGCHGG